MSARHIASHQPAKLAAAEALFVTRAGAPLVLGGWPDPETRTVRFGIEVPYGLSLLAFHDPQAEVQGLDRVPRADWPPVPVVHLAFQVMVGLGTAMALVAAAVVWAAFGVVTSPGVGACFRPSWWWHRWAFSPSEAGWVVTEVGRQPWVIQGVMRTADAVTPMPGLIVPFIGFTVLYLCLGAAVAWLLYRQVLHTARPVAAAEPAE